MTYQELYKPLILLYGEGEAKALVRYLLEEEFGLTLADICSGALDALTDTQKEWLQGALNRMTQGEPVQYVLGKAWFCDRLFQVQQGVLIPRPETEELCRWIIESEAAHECSSLQVLDLCTGSGCIAITLALSIRNAQVSACDISPVALKVAAANAQRLHADVAVESRDVLQQVAEVQPRWHLMVSNPPYVCDSERAGMHRNVLDYEPAEALFVPDDNPLLFYRSICLNALHELLPGGWLYLEINPLFAGQMQQMLFSLHFDEVEVREDSYGRQRFVRARKGL